MFSNGVTQRKNVDVCNAFKNPPIKKKTGSMKQSKLINFLLILSKIFTYLFTFVIVLGSAVVSKGSLLFMTSQISQNRTVPYCNKYLGIHKEFRVTLPRLERLAWIWMLFFSFFVVESITFLKSLRICLFKKWSMPTKAQLVFLFITESLPAVGSALLVFCILPELDVLKGVMLTNAVCFIPAVAVVISRYTTEENEHLETHKGLVSPFIKKVLDVFSILSQATAFVLWPIIENKAILWLIPASVLMISIGWLENYIPKQFIHKLEEWIQKYRKASSYDSDTEEENDSKFKWHFDNGRYFAYLFLSVWKCILFFGTALIIIQTQESSIDFVFKDFRKAFQARFINVTEIKPLIASQTSYNIEEVIEIGISHLLPAPYLIPVWILLINVTATYICYVFSRFACKVMIQVFGCAFPINLAVPATITSLTVLCGLYNVNVCTFHNVIPSYLFFNVPSINFVWEFIGSQQSWIWLLWLLSQTWITIHLWTPKCEKLASTEKLYVKPTYDAFLIDQSIALNRRRDSHNDGITYDDDTTPMIYACATMWHETKEEMMEFLKSIMRLDEDQFMREIVIKELHSNQENYFKLETHIFFDDAFIREHKHDNDPKLNEYVKTLVMSVPHAIVEVYPVKITTKDPKKYVTPYGGRLEWTLPGKTKLIVHLKDKKKIRCRKRWSQVMYMYYLLGYGLMAREDIDPARKLEIANNTFILALDGDIDFQPIALHHLVTLMKRNLKVGAMCGRIHPLGSGPMVWYQIFEYSIGHWLQKATEHVIGCVLCSPGCFSLFRARALMDDNVMAKYTLRCEEARHFVQYDQGEDRWLCTLLLQRGYRVEYCAASDAYTHCPEKFIEFYNQRRRWMPSTMANILDLLIDSKHVLKMNDNISSMYILYQAFLMFSSILGPGTIFLMLVGSLVAAFQISQWSSFLWNVFPIIFFMIICYCCDTKIQLFFAGLLSIIYGLVMMAVLIGVMLQIFLDGPLAPSSLFLFGVTAQLGITALLHPREFFNLKYGIIFYITVPSMYLLLVIYSLFNLNDISWGTRDVTVIQQQSEKSEGIDDDTNDTKQVDITKNKKEKGGLLHSLFGELFTCILCINPKQSDQNMQLLQIFHGIDKVSNRLDEIEKLIEDKSIGKLHNCPEDTVIVNDLKTQKMPKFIDILPEPNNWVNDDSIENGEYHCLPTEEEKFWKLLLSDLLKPYEDNKIKVTKDLKDLRDKSITAFIMLNFIFVLVVFLLTLNKNILHINWPFNVKVNFTYVDNMREIIVQKEYLQLEPIGVVLLTFFASLLTVQFIGMLFHRFATFTQLLASITVKWRSFTKMNRDSLTPEEIADKILKEDPLEGVRMLLKPSKLKEGPVHRRMTVADRARDLKNSSSNEFENLEEAFWKNFKNDNKGGMRKSMANAFIKRRNTVQVPRSYSNSAFEDDY